MSEEKQITLPVLGMTCANCVASVERNSKKVEAVTGATVNYASEKVTFSYDPAVVKGQAVTTAVIERVKRAGYDIPTAELELPLLGIPAKRLDDAFLHQLDDPFGRYLAGTGQLDKTQLHLLIEQIAGKQ